MTIETKQREVFLDEKGTVYLTRKEAFEANVNDAGEELALLAWPKDYSSDGYDNNRYHAKQFFEKLVEDKNIWDKLVEYRTAFYGEFKDDS